MVACCMAMAGAGAQTAETNGGAPESFSNHRVMMGETVVLLAKKYKMTPQDIYEYNPDATEGISQGMLLRIPLHRQVDLTSPQPKKEMVVAYTETTAKSKKPGGAIVKMESKPSYLVADKPVETAEETVQPVEVQAAQAEPAVVQPEVPVQPVTLTHTVQKGETLYGLSQKYGMPVDELKRQNAVLKNGLHVGQILTIAPIDYAAEGYTPHTVQNGETLFGLSRKYGVSVGQITNANRKTLKNGLQAGQTLKIPALEEHAVTADNTQH